MAALNDVTINELEEFYQVCEQHDPEYLQLYRENGKIAILSSGQASTILNLNATGKDINDWVKREDTVGGVDMEGKKLKWLVVLDGMGRSLESNWECGKYVLPHVDVLNLATGFAIARPRRFIACTQRAAVPPSHVAIYD